jgi:hypothetical protein
MKEGSLHGLRRLAGKCRDKEGKENLRGGGAERGADVRGSLGRDAGCGKEKQNY